MTVAKAPISSRASWALGFGVFGFVIVALAALAVLFGYLALREIAQNPELGGAGRARAAIALGVVSIVLWFSLAPFVF